MSIQQPQSFLGTLLNNKAIAPAMSNGVPYWRLSAFYLYYFGFLGAMLPFWGLYLRQQGFGLQEIGTLMAILMSTKLVSPNIWGWIADRTGQRLTVIRLGAVFSALIFLGMLIRPGYWGTALIMAGYSFFWNAILAQFEVVTLNHLGSESHRYSRIRLWGSVGFVVSVVGLGWFFERSSLMSLPYILAVLLALIAVSSFFVGRPPNQIKHVGGLKDFIRQLKSPQVILFFAICFLMQISHGPYYAFFSIFLEDFGYSKTAIGWLWALGVIAEIGVFLVVHFLLSHVGPRTLALLCLLITAVRWWATGAYPDQPMVIIFAQLGHAASFGVFHALAIQMVHRYFSAAAAGQGQALYSALSFGAGGAVGAYLSGFIVETWGGSMAYFMAAAVAVVASGLCLFLVNSNESHKTAYR